MLAFILHMEVKLYPNIFKYIYHIYNHVCIGRIFHDHVILIYSKCNCIMFDNNN